MGTEQASYISGAFWTLSPVVAITSAWEDRINGQIAVTIVNSSIVYGHPRLIVGVWKRNYTHELIHKSGAMVVHLLLSDQLATVKNFGFYTGRDRDKFQGVEYTLGKQGCPILAEAHSYAECRVVNAMDGGDMTIFLVDILAGGLINSGEWMTLQHFYSTAPMEWIQQYEARLAESIDESMKTIENIDYTAWKT